MGFHYSPKKYVSYIQYIHFRAWNIRNFSTYINENHHQLLHLKRIIVFAFPEKTEWDNLSLEIGRLNLFLKKIINLGLLKNNCSLSEIFELWYVQFYHFTYFPTQHLSFKFHIRWINLSVKPCIFSGGSLIIIGISALVCVVTTLSLSAISTNGEVKGGEYLKSFSYDSS